MCIVISILKIVGFWNIMIVSPIVGNQICVSYKSILWRKQRNRNNLFYFCVQVLNPVNSTCESPNSVCVAQLEAAEGFNRKVLKSTPDMSFVLTFGYGFPTIKEEFQSNTYQTYNRKCSFYSLYINSLSLLCMRTLTHESQSFQVKFFSQIIYIDFFFP